MTQIPKYQEWVGFQQYPYWHWSPRWESNSRPTHYECVPFERARTCTGVCTIFIRSLSKSKPARTSTNRHACSVFVPQQLSTDSQTIQFVRWVRPVVRQVKPAVLGTGLVSGQLKADYRHWSNATMRPCLYRRPQPLPGAMQGQQVPFAHTTNQDRQLSYSKCAKRSLQWFIMRWEVLLSSFRIPHLWLSRHHATF